MKKKILSSVMLTIALTSSAGTPQEKSFDYHVDRFADIEVLRYQVPEFDQLSLNQKLMIYYLSEAAQAGRDIIWDQNGKYNLAIREVLETIYTSPETDRQSADWNAFETYVKQVWFGNGIYHHYSTEKFVPSFSREWFENQVNSNKDKLAQSSLSNNTDLLYSIIFDPDMLPKRLNQDAEDVVTASSNNLYEGVSQAEVEAFYASLKDPNDSTPVSYGLNARVVKKDGKIQEEKYMLGGLYSNAIAEIVHWLTLAKQVAENEEQRAWITKLIDFYASGDLKEFDNYSILWAEDTKSEVDFVNGFIESYGDPLGMTGSWESYVNFKNKKSSARTETISANAQWFEDNSPVDAKFRKPEVKGVSAKVITAALLGGDAYPATAIGINLPNANWIRATHGSKSVTLENITEAYSEASVGNGFNKEFVIDKKTSDMMDKYLYITDMLHTDLHECLGHGSGRLLPGVDPDALKEHGSTLEETRADLFALYYLADPKLIELGILDNPEAYKAEYYKYMLNGLMTQLNRIELGKNIEEAHMRNRQLIAAWTLEHGKKGNVVQLVKKGGKTYLKINDYKKLRNLFGELLSEMQRIKSEGDYEAGAKLVNDYAVKVDSNLHQEILKRYSTLDIPPYRGFVNPVYTLVYDQKGNPVDVTISYKENYVEQMLRLSREHSFLK